MVIYTSLELLRKHQHVGTIRYILHYIFPFYITKRDLKNKHIQLKNCSLLQRFRFISRHI